MMMKIAALAEAHHLPCEIHHAGNAGGDVATVHVVMAIPHCSMYAVLVPHGPGEYDLNFLSYGLLEPITFDTRRLCPCADRPGLGIDVDRELLQSHAIGEL
jgi:L-alanine-DL-glutamate epimerase-like enolase superfamily enzyme